MSLLQPPAFDAVVEPDEPGFRLLVADSHPARNRMGSVNHSVDILTSGPPNTDFSSVALLGGTTTYAIG